VELRVLCHALLLLSEQASHRVDLSRTLFSVRVQVKDVSYNIYGEVDAGFTRGKIIRNKSSSQKD
jgi:hypothetical protein